MLLRGVFVIRYPDLPRGAPEPDGDTIKFAPDSPALVEGLPPEITLDPNGYVLTGTEVTAAGGWTLDRDPYLLETSVPGIFAAGDVRFGPVKRVAAAVGEGSMAVAFVRQYLQEPTTS